MVKLGQKWKIMLSRTKMGELCVPAPIDESSSKITLLICMHNSICPTTSGGACKCQPPGATATHLQYKGRTCNIVAPTPVPKGKSNTKEMMIILGMLLMVVI